MAGWERIDERCWMRRLADGSHLVVIQADQRPYLWSWWHRGPRYDWRVLGTQIHAHATDRPSLEVARAEADRQHMFRRAGISTHAGKRVDQ